jgi:hypothetical protein
MNISAVERDGDSDSRRFLNRFAAEAADLYALGMDIL